MKNNLIISEFERLVNFLSWKVNQIKKNNEKNLTTYIFKLKNIKNALITIKKYPFKITLKNYQELGEIEGIGKGTLRRIKEILKNGYLEEIKDFKQEIPEQNKIKAIKKLTQVVGIGPNIAEDFYNQGINSVSQLKKAIKNKKIQVNEKIILGLKYYHVFEENIPRQEIDQVNNMLNKVIKKINKHEKLTKDNKYCLEIAGSYRREKLTSGDIDVLITKFGTTDSYQSNDLKKIIEELKKPLKYNNNKPFLLDDITDKNYETKYMGFCQYKNNPVRRIDIRFIPYTSYHSALLYFTGSGELNKKMREVAKQKGFKLSEYGLFKNNKKIKTFSERDIFRKLNLEFLPPRLR
jgi:DNA polymerase/3'-5' exonuclease PolX